MVRAVGGAIIILGMLARVAGAQGPTLAPGSGPAVSNRLATLGDPLMQPIGLAASKRFAWDDKPSSSAPGPAVLPPPTANYTGSYTTLARPIADTVSTSRPGEAPRPPCADCDVPPRLGNRWLDNLSFFVGLDGSKEPADLGINANFGYRVALNWGLPLLEEAGLGVQVGSAINYSRNALRILPFLDGTVDHCQYFTTVGLFQRTSGGLHWGVVYDFRFDDYYDTVSAGQWRIQVGMEVNANNEFGVWAALRDHGDTAAIGPLTLAVQPINQWNFYWRHIWTNEIVTRLWVGLAEEHSRFNILVPGQAHVNHPFTFGTDIYVPLTDNLAIFGEAHFITPNDTGTVAATLGVAWYPGSARGTARSRFAPLLPLANHSTFALDVR